MRRRGPPSAALSPGVHLRAAVRDAAQLSARRRDQRELSSASVDRDPSFGDYRGCAVVVVETCCGSARYRSPRRLLLPDLRWGTSCARGVVRRAGALDCHNHVRRVRGAKPRPWHLGRSRRRGRRGRGAARRRPQPGAELAMGAVRQRAHRPGFGGHGSALHTGEPGRIRNLIVDTGGPLLSVGGMALLIYAIVKAVDKGWGSAQTLAELGVASGFSPAVRDPREHLQHPGLPGRGGRCRGAHARRGGDEPASMHMDGFPRRLQRAALTTKPACLPRTEKHRSPGRRDGHGHRCCRHACHGPALIPAVPPRRRTTGSRDRTPRCARTATTTPGRGHRSESASPSRFVDREVSPHATSDEAEPYERLRS
jgi:hypothetical protein